MTFEQSDSKLPEIKLIIKIGILCKEQVLLTYNVHFIFVSI